MISSRLFAPIQLLSFQTGTLSHARTSAHTHIHTCERAHARTRAWAHTCARALTHTHTRGGTYMRARMQPHTHTHTHIKEERERERERERDFIKTVRPVFYLYIPALSSQNQKQIEAPESWCKIMSKQTVSSGHYNVNSFHAVVNSTTQYSIPLLEQGQI